MLKLKLANNEELYVSEVVEGMSTENGYAQGFLCVNLDGNDINSLNNITDIAEKFSVISNLVQLTVIKIPETINADDTITYGSPESILVTSDYKNLKSIYKNYSSNMATVTLIP